MGLDDKVTFYVFDYQDEFHKFLEDKTSYNAVELYCHPDEIDQRILHWANENVGWMVFEGPYYYASEDKLKIGKAQLKEVVRYELA